LSDNGITHLGILYKIEYTEIAKILEKLTACNNRIERLRLADKFRISKGLEPLNTSVIKKFTDSPFDIFFQPKEERYEATPEVKTGKEANSAKEVAPEREKHGKTGNKKTNPEPNKEPNPVTTPEANTEATQIPVQTIPEKKEVKPFPKELTYYLYKLNTNEVERRKGNDIYYNQSKVAYLTGFKNHTNEYEPVFDGIFWKVKPNNNLNISVRALPGKQYGT
jgi:hypothetical protein